MQPVMLELTVVSAQRHQLGDEARRRFDAAGGSIGRGSASDWTLPDPESVISREHARIVHAGGEFQLLDVSRNGTFVNGHRVLADAALSLSQGDRIEVGAYTIDVNLIESAPERSVPEPAPAPGRTFGKAAGPAAAEPRAEPPPAPPADPIDALLGDLGADGLAPSGPANPPRGEVAPLSSSPPPFPEDWDPLADDPGPGPSSREEARRETPPAPVPAPESPAIQGPGVPLPGSGTTGVPVARPGPGREPPGHGSPDVPEAHPSSEDPRVAAFFRGLGLPQPGAGADAERRMEELGGALAGALDGLVRVLAARRAAKSEFRLEQTAVAAVGNNPLKFFRSGEELLQRVVGEKAGGYLPLDQAVAEAVRDIKAHEMATAVAMRAAMGGVVSRFDPEAVRERLEETGRSRSLLPAGRNAEAWDMYVSQYRELADGAADAFDRIFEQEFSRAYAAFSSDGGER